AGNVTEARILDEEPPALGRLQRRWLAARLRPEEALHRAARRQDRHERDQDDSEMSYHHVIGATIAHRPAQSSALGSQGNRCSSVAAVGTIGWRREKRGVPVSAEIQVVSR